MIALIADLWENVRVALGGLASNRLRSALTMLGVVIGVGAVIGLMSIGEGAQASITEQISSVGTNLVFVMPGATMSGGPGRVQGAAGSATTLTYDDAVAAAAPGAVPAARYVAPEFGRSTQVIFGNTNINTSVTGVTEVYLKAFELAVSRGRFISGSDVDRRATVAVLGSTAAADLFGGFDPIGQRIKVALPNGGSSVSLMVIGVLEEKGSSMMNSADDSVLVPISAAQTKLFSGRNPLGELIVTRINLVAASESESEPVQDQVEALLRRRHELDDGEDADFTVMSQSDLLSMATEVTGVLTIFLGSIAGISLLVGGIGIMNIMLVSVTERTREIGIRKAVGARKSDILIQFMLEAIVLSVVGGIIGILFGIGLGQLVNLTGLMTSVVTVDSVLMAVGFSAAVGLFFGIYPANRAAGLHPIDALRYE
jgi:putative ABC transport system permease protein